MTDRPWQLRAMRAAELLDETIRLYRHSFVTFVGIVALLQVPTALISTALSAYIANKYPSSMRAARESAIDAQIVLSVIELIAIQPLIMAAMARAVSDRYLERPVSILGAYRKVVAHFLPLVGALLLVFLINIALAVPFLLSSLIPCLGFVVTLAVGIGFLVVNVRLTFVAQAVVLESLSPRTAISRTWDLVKGHGWRVAGIVVLLGVFSLLIVEGPNYLVTFSLAAAEVPATVDAIVSGIVSALLTLLYTPVRMAGTTLLYYDLRIRREGLDLELQADSLIEELRAPPGVQLQI